MALQQVAADAYIAVRDAQTTAGLAHLEEALEALLKLSELLNDQVDTLLSIMQVSSDNSASNKAPKVECITVCDYIQEAGSEMHFSSVRLAAITDRLRMELGNLKIFG